MDLADGPEGYVCKCGMAVLTLRGWRRSIIPRKPTDSDPPGPVCNDCLVADATLSASDYLTPERVTMAARAIRDSSSEERVLQLWNDAKVMVRRSAEALAKVKGAVGEWISINGSIEVGDKLLVRRAKRDQEVPPSKQTAMEILREAGWPTDDEWADMLKIGSVEAARERCEVAVSALVDCLGADSLLKSQVSAVAGKEFVGARWKSTQALVDGEPLYDVQLIKRQKPKKEQP